jgi:hypothetical protein
MRDEHSYYARLAQRAPLQCVYSRLTEGYGHRRDESVRVRFICPQSKQRMEDARDLHGQKVQQDVWGGRYGVRGHV